jgi:hypothetical protein
MGLRERYFRKQEFERAVRELEIKTSAYNSYLLFCGKIKEGAETIEAVEEYLNGKTGFVNPRMSADAMGVLEDYEKIVQLEATFMGLNKAVLSESKKGKWSKVYQVSEEHIESLKEAYTVYYTAEQSKQINALEKTLKGLNELDVPFKSALIYNRRDSEWVWAKQHTDNNLQEYKSKRSF